MQLSNGDDTQQACCAISLCCGGDDGQKQIHALAQIIKDALGDDPHTIHNIAEVIVEHFDLTPKSWGWGVLMRKIGSIARTFPYV